MTPAAAHQLLDRARAGGDVSRAQIAAALRATGDLDAAIEVQLRVPVGAWELRGDARLMRRAGPFDGLGVGA